MENSSIKIFLLTSLLFFCILYPASGQDKVIWRWSDDRWCSQSGSGIISKYDKIEHFIGGGVTYEAYLVIFKGNKLKAFAWAVNTQILWELKDSLVPWEKYGRWGGDGFSWKDAGAGIAGVFIGMLFNDLIKQIFET